ncbi:MAG: hypothetical protein RLZZ230_554 [Candidatus Parcubacteria bacterium]|jgi:hypothetical protein
MHLSLQSLVLFVAQRVATMLGWGLAGASKERASRAINETRRARSTQKPLWPTLPI